MRHVCILFLAGRMALGGSISSTQTALRTYMRKSLTKGIMLLVAALLAWGIPAWGANIAFEFNMDGVLPSAQGATYFTGPGAGVSESTVFATSGGLLTQNATGAAAAFAAFYGVNGFDHTLPATGIRLTRDTVLPQ